MTEDEWQGCTDPNKMLDYLQENSIISDRKQRLLDCACVRRIWHLLMDERGRRAVDIAERYADDMADLEELRDAQAVTLAAADAQATLFLPGYPNSYTVLAAAAGTAWEFRSGADPLRHASEAIAWEGLTENRAPQRRQAKARFAEERKTQAAYLRDIIGNPLRPVSLDRAWLTPSVTTVAQYVYEERAFDQLPILADALEEAGCTDQDTLTHLRGPGPHTRGCWPLDAILGKV